MKSKDNENNKRYVDMHMHTLHSDGSIELPDLLKEILEKEIDIFSVTEHDTVDNIEYISTFSEKNKIKYIPGVELSATFNNRRMHILGYGIDHTNQEIKEFTKSNTILFRKEEDECLNVEYPIPEKAINAIIAAGGVPILAHVGAPFYDPDYRKIIHQMIEKGIVGLECFHPQHSKEVTSYCVDYCRKNKLIISGGSDYHGDCVPSRKLGMLMLTLEDIELNQLSVFIQ